MNAATMQLILALLPMAENLIFNIGGQMVKIATSDLNSQEAVTKALDDAKAAGFPVLSFVTPPALASAPAPAAALAFAQAAVDTTATVGVQNAAAGSGILGADAAAVES